jgi:serine/threonine-protein kinase
MEVRKLQRYDLVERIAAGGMGEVFRARATGPHGFEKTLAVKRVLPELACDEEFVARFVRESKLAVTLSHANIVQVFDLGRADEDLFLVMEYVHGTDLARLLQAARSAGRRLPIGVALLIVAEAAQGLAYAHGRYDLLGHSNHGGTGHVGVIHCDISPSNLLLSYAGEVKLTDFGVAQLVDHTRRTPAQAQHVMGKWRYMAPEQIRGEPVDGRTDLYALGVVLYEILSGQRAFGGDGVKLTCDQVLAGSAPRIRTLRPEVPEALDHLIAQVMSVDARERPADARVFLTQIAEIQRTLDDRITTLDLGALVRELVPPPPDTERRGGLSALVQPFVVEPTGDRGPQVVRRRRPAASFIAQTDPTGSGAITQWLPASNPALPGMPLDGFGSLALIEKRFRWRIGASLLGLMLVVLGIGLFTGLRLRQTEREPGDRATREKGPAAPASLAAPATGTQSPRPFAPASSLPPLIEQIPQELSRMLADRDARLSAGDLAPRTQGRAGQAVRKQNPGYLDIYVEPWANVTIDGRALLQPTPLKQIQVRTGVHHLLLSNPVLKKTREVDVTVTEGQTQKVEIYLENK